MWRQTYEFDVLIFTSSFLVLMIFHRLVLVFSDAFIVGLTINLYIIITPIFVILGSTAGYGLETYIFVIITLSIPMISILFSAVPNIRGKIRLESFSYFIFYFALTCVALILINYGKSLGGSLINVLQNVYNIRQDHQLSTIEAYSIRIFISIIMPLLIWQGFVNRRYTLIIIAFLCSLSLFMTFALKFQLLVFICYVYIFGFRYRLAYSWEVSIVSFLFCVLLGSAILGVLGLNLLDRFLFLPGLLNILYVDFHLDHPLRFFEGSKIGWLIGTEAYYNLDVGYVIDRHYFGGAGMNGNTGYLGSLFADIGYSSILLSGLLLNSLLYLCKLVNERFRGAGEVLACSLCFELLNAPITNVFLSNGFILLFAVVLLSVRNASSNVRCIQ